MMRAAVFFRVCHRCENSVRSLRFPCDLRPRHHGARGPTEVLFGAEVRFTVLRTLALLSTNKKVLWLVVVPCFAAESILGFVLSSLPFLGAYRALEADRAVVARGPMILMAELMSAKSEGTNIWEKTRGRSEKLSENGSGRWALHWIAFFYCTLFVASTIALYYQPDPSQHAPPWAPYIYHGPYAHIAMLFLTVIFALPSVLLTKMPHLCMAAAFLLFVFVALTAPLLSLKMPNTADLETGESIPFQLECREPFPVASFAIGSGMTVGHSRAYQRGQNRVFTLLTCVLLRSPHPLLYLHL